MKVKKCLFDPKKSNIYGGFKIWNWTDLWASQVGQIHGFMNTGSYNGDHSIVAFPLHNLHM